MAAAQPGVMAFRKFKKTVTELEYLSSRTVSILYRWYVILLNNFQNGHGLKDKGVGTDE